MSRRRRWLVVAGLALLAGAGVLWAARAKRGKNLGAMQTEDVIYGRKAGLALTLNVLLPPHRGNGLGVLGVVSSGWISRPALNCRGFYVPLLERGYTVFTVIHGSQPTFTIPEILPDVDQAVRFVRCHAGDYGIDPERIGIFGGSAGGHLALMQGTTGGPGDPSAADPVARASGRVQAVAVFCPFTDFLNFGARGRLLTSHILPPPLNAALDYRVLDSVRGLYVPVTDEGELRAMARRLSPISHVSAASPPTLLIHGDSDPLVPLQQSQSMLARLQACGVPAQLVVKKGAGHAWSSLHQDMELIADWFDLYLARGGPVPDGGAGHR